MTTLSWMKIGRSTGEYFDHHGRRSVGWFWGSNRVPNMPGVDQDHAVTLEKGKATFKCRGKGGSRRHVVRRLKKEAAG
jgi:hypothetical protein